jgi:protein-S-isoprenylcysteine O-methyltransferase Ste14
LITGNAVFTWAMASNNFFSTVVRIQNDRNHAVATTGPYKIVRHPGYVGFILQTAATPLILGTIWGLIPAGIVCVLFVIRTAFEDTALQEELIGYHDYTKKTRYRLIPGVW